MGDDLDRVARAAVQWSESEQAVLDEVRDGLRRGRAVYGQLELGCDDRDFGVETLEELRDGIVYICAWLVQARHRRESDAEQPPLKPTHSESLGVAAVTDCALDAVMAELEAEGVTRDWRGEVAAAARRWADRGRDGR